MASPLLPARQPLSEADSNAIIFPLKLSTAAPKRKAEKGPDEVIDVDSDDERLQTITMSCNQVRSKINAFLRSGEMKAGDFYDALGVSGNSVRNFLAQKGTMGGAGSDAYPAAFAFFKKRELMGMKMPKKRVKKEDEEKLQQKHDLSGIELETKSDGKVPVYDTCDEVRKKINAYLKQPAMTQAAFLRAIAQTHPEGKKFQSKSLTDFMGKRGPKAGNTSGVFYASYIFFEKMRIKEGKPKSKHREEMEKIYGKEGFDIESSRNWYTCGPGERPYMDQYGRVEFY